MRCSKTASSFNQVVHADRHQPFAEWEVMECVASLRLDIGRPDHLGPLLGFGSDMRAEVGG